MSTAVERSRYYAQVDTGDWEFPDIVSKVVFNPKALTLADKLRWREMCARVGLDPNF